jgi:hypothetical protein
LSFALFAGRPAVLAIEEADGARRILPLRICADHAPAAEQSARTVDVGLIVAGRSFDGIYLYSAGGVADTGQRELLEHLPLGAGATSIGEAILTNAYGTPPDLVRLWLMARLPIAESEALLEGVVAAKPLAAALILGQGEPSILTVEVGTVATTGDVDHQVVGAELRSRRDELASCAARAAYAEPWIETIEASLVYAGAARPQVALDPALDAGAASCLEGVLGAVAPLRRERATGSATVTLTVKRTAARR